VPKPRPHPHAGPALASLVLAEVPSGLRALDALAKEAPVEVLGAGTIQCGLYLIVIGGHVEPVRRSLDRALEAAAGAELDVVLLPHAEERTRPAVVEGLVRWPAPGDTLGVVQTPMPPTLLRALDAALKGAKVELVEARLGDGLGGKGLAMLWGETPDVEAALALANEAIARGRADGASSTIVRNADAEVRRALGARSGFFKEWRG
jgi:microcompartment protein CcmL/EutN